MLPAPVKRRIKALKQLQLKTTNIEAKFFQEVHELECKYYQMCVPLYDQRSQIVSGVYEPTDEQCAWESEEEEELSNDLKSKVNIDIKDESEIKKEAEIKKDTEE
ncbi:nucleosome assembly protein 1-like 1 [Belonocnema kinseyi]|uniref:nucleosome assembly protein 1-like 1 n=1 Tax=Belonocnema kinseyi TaxID=2817044 RepID=UPI00143CE274|nr:nucleosome assembly protein 1-like 1 [Belonocnema kinseyi]